MAYKKGTYKLNLGLSEDEKEILDFIRNKYQLRTLSETVRFCIREFDLKDAPPTCVDYGGILKELNDVKEELKKVSLLLKVQGVK